MTSTAYQLGVQHALAQLMKRAAADNITSTSAGAKPGGATFGDIPGAFTGSLIDGRQTPAAAAGAPRLAAPPGGAPLTAAKSSSKPTQ